MSDDLKPCPFCGGGAAAQARVNFVGYHYVGCECGAEGPASPSADDARSLWNTRPGEEELRAEVDPERISLDLIQRKLAEVSDEELAALVGVERLLRAAGAARRKCVHPGCETRARPPAFHAQCWEHTW